MGPRREPLSQWLPHQRGAVTVIRCEDSNFDYHGLHQLHAHREDPLVRADSYLYLLDTTSAEPDFLQCYEALRVGHAELLISPSPSSNICAFGHGVLEAFGDNFQSPLTKAQAIAVEHEDASASAVKPVQYFAQSVRRTPQRQCRGSRDVYSTGTPRWVFHLPTFGVCKHILLRGRGVADEGPSEFG
eukprot:3871502-Prymnesium_polylepis.2